ncbi:hypothetical protein OOZ51_03135 [Arthrobacter sp. MI7-26]|nr:hypothetical protein [Arthrobacter sp. MI7-26]
MLEVRVDHASKVDRALDDAIAEVQGAATRHQTGMMITRTGPGKYTVRADPAVPFGLIRQQHQ